MEIRIEHTTDYPWDLLLLADPSRELVDCYLKTSDCFAAFSGDKPVGVIVVQKETEEMAEVMNLAGDYSELAVRRALKNSKVLSSDVSAAFDPNYPSVMEKKNSAYFGKGLVFNKYTGARGKSGSNDANAEYVARLRNIMDTADVSFQTAELGKVDEGGGGTIAYILANYDMNVIDSGVPVLNMHAPWEIISKVDLYEAFRGYIAFLKEA